MNCKKKTKAPTYTHRWKEGSQWNRGILVKAIAWHTILKYSPHVKMLIHVSFIHDFVGCFCCCSSELCSDFFLARVCNA